MQSYVTEIGDYSHCAFVNKAGDKPCLGYGGHPCTFPFIYKDCKLGDPSNVTKSYYCESFNDSIVSPLNYVPSFEDTKSPWCAIRTFPNNTAIPGAWGYVREECKSQMPGPSRPENLASSSFESLWNSRLFYLEPWVIGHCHTYTSNDRHPNGKDGHFYAFLGDGLQKKTISLRGYQMYVHSAQVTSINKNIRSQ